MTIRKATTADLTDLSQVFDEYRVFYRKESDVEGAKKFLKARMNGEESVIYIALHAENTMMGFVQLYPLFSSTRMHRMWLLNDLYVNPKFRGLGVSKALIAQAKQLVIDTDACALTLETEKSNVIGNQLYPATDFKLDEDHHYYYWDK